jgi:trigger factor
VIDVNLQKLSPVLVEADVRIAAERVQSELNKAYTSVQKSARVRGFRPGKAPRSVLVHMFGARVAADVARRLVDETFPKVVDEHKLQPVNSPAIEPQKLVENQPFSYKARFEIVPEIGDVNYEGLEAKRPKTEVTDALVTEELDKLRQANSTLEAPAKPRAACKGDVVTIDYHVEAAGQHIDDAGAEDFQAEVGSGTLIAAIDEALVGKKPGDHVHAEVEMPAQHPHPGLKGQKVTFHITIKDLKERVLPDADDEFAKDLGEFDTLDELKQDLKKQIEKRLKEQADNAVAEQLVLELVKHNPIPLPPSLVQRQVELAEREVLTAARRQGQNATGLSDELRAKLISESETKVRAGLLMAEIAKRHQIQIGDAELEEGMAELAEQSGKNVAKLRAEYRDPQKREMLVGMILENKVLDIVESKAKIEES